ncbi:hypothetical protein HD806DRAFT_540623 [Xylariaceae sp. AK1471]|nr:hypothetical protein HD806DRAFT_540623 [Xylariaceae sp. AK1471]
MIHAVYTSANLIAVMGLVLFPTTAFGAPSRTTIVLTYEDISVVVLRDSRANARSMRREFCKVINLVAAISTTRVASPSTRAPGDGWQRFVDRWRKTIKTLLDNTKKILRKAIDAMTSMQDQIRSLAGFFTMLANIICIVGNGYAQRYLDTIQSGVDGKEDEFTLAWN